MFHFSPLLAYQMYLFFLEIFFSAGPSVFILEF